MKTAPVGSYRANAFGLYDVIGSVGDWVQDCATMNYDTLPADGEANASGDCTRQMTRGGSWGSMLKDYRSANRMRYEANADLLRSYVGTPFHNGGDYIGTEDPLATQLERRRQIINSLPGQFNSGGKRGSVQFTREIFDHLTVTKLDPRYAQMRADPIYGNLVRGSWAEGEKDPNLYERRTAIRQTSYDRPVPGRNP